MATGPRAGAGLLRERQHDLSLMAMPAGEGVGLVRSMPGAAEMADELVRPAAEVLLRVAPSPAGT